MFLEINDSNLINRVCCIKWKMYINTYVTEEPDQFNDVYWLLWGKYSACRLWQYGSTSLPAHTLMWETA